MIGEVFEKEKNTKAIPFERSSKPVPVDERARLLSDPGFGRVFTDHMAIVEYDEDRGWHNERITARHPFKMDPASPVLHYAQEIFEGMKAYHRTKDVRRCSDPSQCATLCEVRDPPGDAAFAGRYVPQYRPGAGSRRP